MVIPLHTLVPLYLAFVVKHLLADYLFQTAWMVRGKEASSGWVAPLSAHCAVHAVGTLLIVLVAAPAAWWLAPLDFAVHFAIDRGKAVATRRLALTPAHGPFWWMLGGDQALHQTTHFVWVLTIAAAVSAA